MNRFDYIPDYIKEFVCKCLNQKQDIILPPNNNVVFAIKHNKYDYYISMHEGILDINKFPEGTYDWDTRIDIHINLADPESPEKIREFFGCDKGARR